MQVAAVRTPVTMGAVLQALRLEWRALMRGALRSDVAALLLALVDLETRTGRSVKNFNLGNMIVTSEQELELPYYEGLDGENVRHFQSFGSLRKGARGFIRQLTRDSRKEWRRGLLTGNPRAFVRALGGRDGGLAYFEANFKRYLDAFLVRWQRYAPKGAGGGAVALLLSAAALAGGVAYAMR